MQKIYTYFYVKRSDPDLDLAPDLTIQKDLNLTGSATLNVFTMKPYQLYMVGRGMPKTKENKTAVYPSIYLSTSKYFQDVFHAYR